MFPKVFSYSNETLKRDLMMNFWDHCHKIVYFLLYCPEFQLLCACTFEPWNFKWEPGEICCFWKTIFKVTQSYTAENAYHLGPLVLNNLPTMSYRCAKTSRHWIVTALSLSLHARSPCQWPWWRPRWSPLSRCNRFFSSRSCLLSSSKPSSSNSRQWCYSR